MHEGARALRTSGGASSHNKQSAVVVENCRRAELGEILDSSLTPPAPTIPGTHDIPSAKNRRRRPGLAALSHRGRPAARVRASGRVSSSLGPAGWYMGPALNRRPSGHQSTSKIRPSDERAVRQACSVGVGEDTAELKRASAMHVAPNRPRTLIDHLLSAERRPVLTWGD